MEPGMYFTLLVFSVAGLQLVWQAAARLSKWLGMSNQNLMYGNRRQAKRDDWYVFFHRSDLTGSLNETSSVDTTVNQRPASTAPRKRKGANRPVARIHLS